MKTVTEKLSNGNIIEYVCLDNETCYHKNTPQQVIDVLERVRINGTRVRVFYGDIATGRDWNEQCDVFGTIGRSTGRIKIPLLIHNRRSLGGPALLDNCIVKIIESKGRRRLYVHPTYNN